MEDTRPNDREKGDTVQPLADPMPRSPKAAAYSRERKESTSSYTSTVSWSGNQAHARKLSKKAVSDEAIPAYTPDQKPVEGRVTLSLAVTTAVAIFGNSFPHGWNTGVLNTPAPLIHRFLNDSYNAHYGRPTSEAMQDFLWAASVSIYLVGGCAGAFSAGWFANKFGRKRGLLICHIFGYASAILFGFCKLANSLEMLMIARLIIGFGCGAGSGLVPMYLTEIAPTNLRGAMGVMHQFALTCGILLSQCFGISAILGQENVWPILLALTVVPCTVSVLLLGLLPLCPESPQYLYFNKNDQTAAEKALIILRGTDNVSADISEMINEKKLQEKESEWTFRQLLKCKQLRLSLVLVCGLAICQQLSGINVVFFYSTSIFLRAGIAEHLVQWANIATGIINVLMTGISVPLMEKCGRKILLLGGMGLMVFAMIALTIALSLQDSVSWMSYISIIGVLLFVIGFAIGLGSIPQFIGAELFKPGPRPPAMSLAGLSNWLCNFIVGISFPFMERAIKAYSFLVFMAIVILFGIFFWKKLPETKGKTYSEIYAEMKISDISQGVDDDSNEKEMKPLNTIEVDSANHVS